MISNTWGPGMVSTIFWVLKLGSVVFWHTNHWMCLCCAVEEIMTELEENIQQRTDERLAEQREIELLKNGTRVDHYDTQCMLPAAAHFAVSGNIIK